MFLLHEYMLQVERLAYSLLPSIVFRSHVLSSHYRMWAYVDQITRGSDYNWLFRTALAHQLCDSFDGQSLIKISE